MTYVCVKKCFFRGRIWALGETLVPSPGESVPKHFITKDKYVPEPVVDLKDPKTFHELQKKENAAALAAVGHKPVVPSGPKNAEGQVAGQQAGAGAGGTDFLA